MNTWNEILINPQLEQQYMINLRNKIMERRAKPNIKVYPEAKLTFRAFKETPYENVKVVIVGQDPYPGTGVADGLAFSTKQPVIPSSLKYIFEEINNDLYKGTERNKFTSADLSVWASQGVLLLNAVLTVEESRAGSHKGKQFGWEMFTAAAMRQLNNHQNPLVFLLWGREAQVFASYIIDSKHLILTAAHPNAESYRVNAGFFGCRHFSKTNEFLKSHNLTEINWTTS